MRPTFSPASQHVTFSMTKVRLKELEKEKMVAERKKKKKKKKKNKKKMKKERRRRSGFSSNRIHRITNNGRILYEYTALDVAGGGLLCGLFVTIALRMPNTGTSYTEVLQQSIMASPWICSYIEELVRPRAQIVSIPTRPLIFKDSDESKSFVDVGTILNMTTSKT